MKTGQTSQCMRIYLILYYSSSSLKACLYNQNFSVLNKYMESNFPLSNIEQILEELAGETNI